MGYTMLKQPLRYLGSWALFHYLCKLLLLVMFELLTAPIIPMDGLRHRAPQGHAWTDGCTCQSKSLYLQGPGEEGRFRVLPSQALFLVSMCTQWRDVAAMPTRCNVPCLTCPWPHWRFVAAHGVRARSLVISFAFLLLTHSVPSDFSFCYGCQYLKLSYSHRWIKLVSSNLHRL